MPHLKTVGDAIRGRLTRKQAADYLGFSVKTLADWTLKGIGPKSILVGRRRFYRIEDLHAWIKAGERR
jgi:hypothetical protein